MNATFLVLSFVTDACVFVRAEQNDRLIPSAANNRHTVCASCKPGRRTIDQANEITRVNTRRYAL